MLTVAALLAAFLCTPVGTALWSLAHYQLGGALQYWVAAAWGLAGVLLVAVGLGRGELAGSLLGFLGGWMIWGGWFQFGFQGFAELLSVPPLYIAPELPLPGSNGLLIASAPMLLAVFLLYGMLNRETRCLFMRFVMRHGRVSPGVPTAGVRREPARIAAMETVLIIWTLNVVWLLIYWAVGFGALLWAVFALYSLWALYLVSRQLRLTRAGYALRYAIPVGLIAWIMIELPAQFGLWPAFWQRPLQHPLAFFPVLALFAASVLVLARGSATPRRLTADGVGSTG
jgi:hypothetical protein